MIASSKRPRIPTWCLPAVVALAVLLIAPALTGTFGVAPALPPLARLWLGVVAGGFCFTVLLFLRYRPTANRSDRELPPCTVVVPAFNEGSMVLETLRSVLASDYPADLLQVIAVDDGSVDDTWAWMKKAADEADGRIELVRQPSNQGKRQALYQGFRRAKGEVLVTIDSDSLIEADTLRAMVSPFVEDERVGAVAGRVAVHNQHEGAIPRMLEVSFAYSFEFIRASQSSLDTVLCTPGALSAYRRVAVMKVLDAWLNQTFLGQPAKIGEDRAMTNAILRSGYYSRFQSTAVVHTNVPTDYGQLRRMFLRWARSNVRETLAMGAFVFTRFRRGAENGARLLFLLSAIRLAAAPLVLLFTLGNVLSAPSLFLLPLLLGAAISGCVPALFYLWRRRSLRGAWSIPYALFWLGTLSWITPYAMVTAGNSGWLTRHKPQTDDRQPGWPNAGGVPIAGQRIAG